ncbi:2-amino-4-hydroxy-6-hydroxymethyldihydropteridine diphosphokinase [Halotalea alkalilenta]|uniref:2-amino-4-hydroxy-6-hydroxymethyldihydropteridine diphosphokinase n=1 Tax=Halotalea alkalilenta TaxID=376489 RepID=A0A172YH17_9GAMM|nr:2-amino-4-hydroxy-6-hydroxymethyldihydropteridine diphosphokinase [Halotalea alkalilenta]ANF58544.1 2-amino-4-hydroxy-6-hydroxymethyldihydropteridine pyrophosphokinase [Halotalea alkalilenta]
MKAEARWVLIGIGTNLERERHVCLALDALEQRFGALEVSRVFESEPVGYRGGHNFYNLVAGFESEIGVAELSAWTKALEHLTGRRPEDPKYGPRRLDLDLLCIGDLDGTFDGVELPRGEILTSAFVLRPLGESFATLRHPRVGQRFDTLWGEFDPGEQRLWPVEFSWRGRRISRPD